MAIAQVKPPPGLKAARKDHEAVLTERDELQRRVEAQETTHQKAVEVSQEAQAAHQKAVGAPVSAGSDKLRGTRSALQEAAGDVSDAEEVLDAIRAALEANETARKNTGTALRREMRHVLRDAVVGMQDRVSSDLQAAMLDYSTMRMLTGADWGAAEMKVQRLLNKDLFQQTAELAKGNARELQELSRA